jgi:deazaflavin-dependent oxidoreductase (nitroreductase family)
MTLTQTWLRLIDRSLNKVTARMARTGHGPISLIRHRGRKSGTIYETPIIVAATDGGFVCELTYGDQVAWYRNLIAAGEGDLLVKGTWHHIDAIEPCTTANGLAAFGGVRAVVLKVLQREEFRFLREGPRSG